MRCQRQIMKHVIDQPNSSKVAGFRPFPTSLGNTSKDTAVLGGGTGLLQVIAAMGKYSRAAGIPGMFSILKHRTTSKVSLQPSHTTLQLPWGIWHSSHLSLCPPQQIGVIGVRLQCTQHVWAHTTPHSSHAEGEGPSSPRVRFLLKLLVWCCASCTKTQYFKWKLEPGISSSLVSEGLSSC